MIRAGVIGYGYWGPNLVRNFSEAKNINVTAVSDLRPDRLELAQSRCPGIKATVNHQELIEDPQIDAIAIATPVSTHYELAMQALTAGKHVLVEKPFTSTSDQGRRLIDAAAKRNLTLMVDHTFIFTGAVKKIAELIAEDQLGQVYYFDSVRANLGLFQHDVNVLWDLAVHDLSILTHILPFSPTAVSASGISHVTGEPEDVAYLTLFFDSNIMAHIHVNWLSPAKIRRTIIGGSRKMIIYDDLEPSEKIKIYDRGINVKNSTEGLYKMLISYRTGDMWAPRLDATEALLLEVEHFARCIEENQAPLTDAASGLRVVSILEAATRSMKARGKLVKLETERRATDAPTRHKVVGIA